MKSLSLNRPLVIMMVGVPGAGKSFFARQFAETFGAPIVSVDRLRTLLFAEPSFSKDEDTLIAQVASSEIGELLKTHKTFLVDGGLNARTERASLTAAARKAGYGSLIVWVQTDQPTAKRRSIKRNPNKADDSLNAAMPVERFETLSKKLTAPTAQEKFVVISGKHTYATQAKVVLRKLAAPRPERPPQAQARPLNSNHHVSPQAPKRRNVTIN